jgi:hypothetical protein
MNTHLMRTRIASIQHYTEELAKLQQATLATQQTRKELLDSMREFFPFEPGQILIRGEAVRKLKCLDEVRLGYTNEIVFSVFTYPPKGDGFDYNHERQGWGLSDLNQWRIISHPKPAEQ